MVIVEFVFLRIFVLSFFFFVLRRGRGVCVCV